MPNGDLCFDLEDLERYFAPVAEAVQEFAVQRNLLLEKYYHDSHDWALRFNHPAGGEASLHLRRDQEEQLQISSVWHFDDYDKFTRYLHWRSEHDCPREPSAVTVALENELKGILAVEFGNWNQVASEFQNIWGRISKEQFQSMTPKLPSPRLDS